MKKKTNSFYGVYVYSNHISLTSKLWHKVFGSKVPNPRDSARLVDTFDTKRDAERELLPPRDLSVWDNNRTIREHYSGYSWRFFIKKINR